MDQATQVAETTATTEETVQTHEQATTEQAAGTEETNLNPSEETTTDSGEEQAEPTAKEQEEQKKQASERTRRRRQQRRDARIKRETEARIQAEREAAYYRGLAEGKGQGQHQGSEDGNKAPEPEDFDDYADFIDARFAWNQKQQGKAQEITQETTQQQPQPQKTAGQGDDQAPLIDQEVLSNFVQAGEQKYGEDFQEMLEAAQNIEFALTDTMGEVMMDSDVSIDIAMHLYDNPEEAARIANLSPAKQVREINGLEAQLKNGTLTVSSSAGTSQPTQKTVSQAPAPVSPEKGGEVPSVDPSKMSTKEYIKHRQKQLYGSK